VLGEDVLSEVAASESGDTGDEDAHLARTLARAVPSVGCLACRRERSGELAPNRASAAFTKPSPVTSPLRHGLCDAAGRRGRERRGGPVRMFSTTHIEASARRGGRQICSHGCSWHSSRRFLRSR
jgi:hypothetical protein